MGGGIGWGGKTWGKVPTHFNTIFATWASTTSAAISPAAAGRTGHSESEVGMGATATQVAKILTGWMFSSIAKTPKHRNTNIPCVRRKIGGEGRLISPLVLVVF